MVDGDERAVATDGHRPALLWWRRATFLGALLTILWLSVASVPGGPDFPHHDKLKHLAAYALLAWLGCWAHVGRPAWLALGLIAYGVGLEGLQFLGGSRNAEVADAVANTLGVALGTAVWLVRKRRRAAPAP